MRVKKTEAKNLGKTFGVRLDEATERAIEKRAKQVGVPPTTLIRQCCEAQYSVQTESISDVAEELKGLKKSLAETQKTLSILADVLAKTATKKEVGPAENDGKILEKLEAILKDTSGMKFNCQASAFASNVTRIMLKEFGALELYGEDKVKAFLDKYLEITTKEAGRFQIPLKGQ